MEDFIAFLIILGLVIAIIFGTFSWAGKNEKESCYERAMYYNSNVKGFSFWKDYCFIDKDGKTIDINNNLIQDDK